MFTEDKLPLKLISLIKQSQSLEVKQTNIRDTNNETDHNFVENPSKRSKLMNKRNENCISYRQESKVSSHECKPIEDEINDFIRVVSDEHFAVNSTLDFWKSNELRFKNLAKVAKKCLGAPPSSAAVERIFSIAGHIFSSKRRRMGDVLFAILVFLKLNEVILKTI